MAAEALSTAIGKMIKDDEGAHPVKTVGECMLTAKMNGDKVTLTDEKNDVELIDLKIDRVSCYGAADRHPISLRCCYSQQQRRRSELMPLFALQEAAPGLCNRPPWLRA